MGGIRRPSGGVSISPSSTNAPQTLAVTGTFHTFQTFQQCSPRARVRTCAHKTPLCFFSNAYTFSPARASMESMESLEGANRRKGLMTFLVMEGTFQHFTGDRS